MKEQLNLNIEDMVVNQDKEGLATVLDEYFENNLTEKEKQTREGDRCDQKHGSLGEELSMREIQVHGIIQNSDRPIQAEEISEMLFDYKEDVDLVRSVVFRIRKKLGSNAIITDEETKGYISRNKKVEEEHINNSFWSMLEESINKVDLVSSFSKDELAAILDLYFINSLSYEEKQTRESDRSDQQKNKLGEKLTMRERQVYESILESGLENLSPEEISEEVFGKKSNTNSAWTYIRRIKDKIGSTAVRYDNKSRGYVSRRVLIENGAY